MERYMRGAGKENDVLIGWKQDLQSAEFEVNKTLHHFTPSCYNGTTMNTFLRRLLMKARFFVPEQQRVYFSKWALARKMKIQQKYEKQNSELFICKGKKIRKLICKQLFQYWAITLWIPVTLNFIIFFVSL